ncbi:MAG TPA: molybdopterin molybdotransferase MoeA, partial [Longimicrobiales bacterium]|nr:molybdopterin molybdotransferase MoeA [Longimicrobiales bacterium]
MPSFETRAADWLSFGEARDRILRRAAPLETESVAADDALGRALAGPLNAEITLPPWDNSAMDGYAVAAREVEGAREGAPVILAVAREIRPGDEAGPALEPGQAARIMTGAPVPAGADSVVRVEDTDREAAESGRVRILSDRDAGGNVRPAGEDLREGERIYEAGTGIGPGQVAVLTALGVRRVEVHRRPRVAVLASGDELAGPDDFDRVRAGRAIPNSNSPLVAAAARIAGADPVRLGIAADSEESVREHLLRSLGSDVLVTLGGASMGAGDLFKG